MVVKALFVAMLLAYTVPAQQVDIVDVTKFVTGFFAGADTVPCVISPCAKIDVPTFNGKLLTIWGSF
jgi:hypothetical protein